jgi:hypothetical protein
MVTSQNTALAKTSQSFPSVSSEKRMQQQRMDDVMLLIENLVDREEATVKLIIDCLYDVGSVNLINKKFRTPPVKGLMKYIARLSKPVFKIVAFRWFRKNCPQLITNWLQSKVRF